MGMIEKAVDKMVNAIGEEEVKNSIASAVETKVNTMVTTEINNVLEHGIKDVIKKALIAKLDPVIKAIEAIDIGVVVAKVGEISIGSDIDEMVEQLASKLKSKITSGIEQAEAITIDISEYTARVNEIIGEQVIDITEDDDDVEEIIKSKVLESVKNIKV